MCFAPQRRALFRHFFDIWTSKSGPSMVCFVHFDFEMCFAPQRRALFRHLNFQKWSEHVVLCTFWLPNVLRSKCTKHTMLGPLLEVEMSKKCTPLWREAHFEVKMYKAHQVRTTFGSWDVEKVHAVVARSTFPSQNVQNTPCSDHFWRFRCRKSARRCGAKHISKSECTKHHMFAPLLEVRMLKKCTPLWREAHLEVKMYKAPHARTTFGSSDVEKVHAVVARSTFRSQNVQNTPCSDHFWRFRCRKSVEKVHAVVARSTFRSQKCKKLRVLSLFWREDVEKVDTD